MNSIPTTIKMNVCTFDLNCLAQDSNLPNSKLPFAWKLFDMLESCASNGLDDVVSWVDDGTGFRVHDQARFVSQIIPSYFKQKKYKSFQRQLYFYGFQRATSSSLEGGNRRTVGSYHHPSFQRCNKSMCLSMVPKKNNKSAATTVTTTPLRRNRAPSPRRVSFEENTISNGIHSNDDDDIEPLPLYPSYGKDCVHRNTSHIDGYRHYVEGLEINDIGEIDEYYDDILMHKKPAKEFRRQEELRKKQREQFYRSIGLHQRKEKIAPNFHHHRNNHRSKHNLSAPQRHYRTSDDQYQHNQHHCEGDIRHQKQNNGNETDTIYSIFGGKMFHSL